MAIPTSLYSYTIFDQRTKELVLLANTGDKRAQYKLGRAYLRGTTVKYNRHTAYAWLKKSAAQNYYKAWYSLGKMRYTSKYNMQNYTMAFRWFMKAAKQNHGQSQYYIALMYFSGNGISKQNYKAMVWAVRAKRNGAGEASDLLSAIQFRISQLTAKGQRVSSIRAKRKMKLAAKRKLRAVAKAKAKAKRKARLAANAKAATKRKRALLAKRKLRAMVKAKAAAKSKLARKKIKTRMRTIAKAKADEIKANSEAKVSASLRAKMRLKELILAASNAKEKTLSATGSVATNLQSLKKPAFDFMNILDVRTLLYGEKWAQNGNPSDYIPSALNQCIESENSINCISRRIRQKLDGYTVHFSIISTIGEFRAKGEFTIRHRKNYLLVLGDSPKSKTKMPVLGVSSKVNQLYCRLLNKTRIECLKPDRSKVVLTSGFSTESGAVTTTSH